MIIFIITQNLFYNHTKFWPKKCDYEKGSKICIRKNSRNSKCSNLIKWNWSFRRIGQGIVQKWHFGDSHKMLTCRFQLFPTQINYYGHKIEMKKERYSLLLFRAWNIIWLVSYNMADINFWSFGQPIILIVFSI